MVLANPSILLFLDAIRLAGANRHALHHLEGIAQFWWIQRHAGEDAGVLLSVLQREAALASLRALAECDTDLCKNILSHTPEDEAFSR